MGQRIYVFCRPQDKIAVQMWLNIVIIVVICNPKRGSHRPQPVTIQNMSRNIFAYVFIVATFCVAGARAQKPFSEGTIVYKVALSTPDGQSYKGVYTFLFKDGQVRKELVMENGYHDITLINGSKNTLYTLQERDGKKYAIQLSMEDDLMKKQKRFKDFKVLREEKLPKPQAGQPVYRTVIMYKDSTTTDIVCNKDWRPDLPYTWNRFPDASFMPLTFSYKEESGVSMVFTAEKMEAAPVLTSMFTIPPDYKIITNKEYRQLRN